MATLPSGFAALAEIAQQGKPWIWNLRIEAQLEPDVAPIVFPLTTYTAEVTWPPTGPDAEVYYPFPFKFDNIEQNSEGDLPQVDVVLDNSTRVMMDLAYQAHGFEGSQVRLVLLNEDTLDTATESVEFRFEVVGSEANNESLTLRLGVRNFFEVQIPSDRFVANRCRHKHGGLRCGYIVNDVAAFSTCDKTLTACIAHGDDEVARGLPRLHPRRFGGFRGIPVQRT